MLPVKLHLLVKALNAPLGKAPFAAQLSHGNLWLCNLNSRRGHQRVKDDRESDFKSKGSRLLVSLSPSLRLCRSLNNVICRGMWVSGALLSPGESNHTPFTHTHTLQSPTKPCLLPPSASPVNSLRDVMHFS